jgi:hypothetical protein
MYLVIVHGTDIHLKIVEFEFDLTVYVFMIRRKKFFHKTKVFMFSSSILDAKQHAVQSFLISSLSLISHLCFYDQCVSRGSLDFFFFGTNSMHFRRIASQEINCIRTSYCITFQLLVTTLPEPASYE